MSMPKDKQAKSKKPTRGKGARKPSVRHSRAEKDAKARVKRGHKSSRGLGPPCEKCGQIHKRCSAHNNRGGPCGQQPLRFQDVCRSHGGNNKLSRAAAQERMMELVYPALARLDQLVNDPDTDPAIVVKVVAQILDRAHAAGLSRNSTLDVSLREKTEWELLQEQLGHEAVLGFNRAELDEPDEDEHPALDSGGVGDSELDAQLETLLAERDRRREREAATRLDNSGHDVIAAEIPDEAPRTAGSRRYERAEDD